MTRNSAVLLWLIVVFVSACNSGPDSACVPPSSGSKGVNPLVPGIFTADPAVLIHDCTFYITAGHDESVSDFFLKDWYVLSSSDLVNWTDNGGPVLGLDVFAWADANAWASQMVEKDGVFYWFVPVNKIDGGMAIGVAKADSPLGPFEDAIGAPLVDDIVEMEAFGYEFDYQTVYTIDPTVLVDGSRAFLSYGGFGRMVTVELGADMVSLAGKMVEETPEHFFEAPYLMKKDNIYYLIYAGQINPATIDYASASSPFGPWTYGGRIMDPLPNLPGEDYATSHPAVAEYAGQWYLVYHRSDGEGGGTYRRQVAIDKLFFNEDGTILPVMPSSGIMF